MVTAKLRNGNLIPGRIPQTLSQGPKYVSIVIHKLHRADYLPQAMLFTWREPEKHGQQVATKTPKKGLALFTDRAHEHQQKKTPVKIFSGLPPSPRASKSTVGQKVVIQDHVA